MIDLINPTNACGDLLYFTPFLSFACQSYTAIDEGGTIFTENADGLTVPGIGGITLGVPQVPFCTGLVNYDIELCVEDQTTDGEEPLAESALFGIIGGLPGGIYSVFPNIDDKHVSCTTFLGFCTGPECYNQNGWSTDPSGEQISITTVNRLFGTDQLDWDFLVNVNCNSTFPTICPDCEVVGAPVAVRFLPQLNINTIPAPADLCDGESINLFGLNPTVSNAAALGSYSWYEGASSGGVFISDASNPSIVIPVGSEQYCAKFTNSNGCVNSVCASFTYDPRPQLLSAAPILCADEALDLISLNSQISTAAGTFDCTLLIQLYALYQQLTYCQLRLIMLRHLSAQMAVLMT